MNNTIFYNLIFDTVKDFLGVYTIGNSQLPAINRNFSKEYSYVSGLEVIVKDGIYKNLRIGGDYNQVKIFFVHLIQHSNGSDNLALVERDLSKLGYSFETRENEKANITNELLIYRIAKFVIVNCPCE
jgi:hypothetical protein